MTAATTRQAPVCCRIIEAKGIPTQSGGHIRTLRLVSNSTTNFGILATLALAASLALASPAFGASAGEEYLPKLPTAGASSSGNEYGVDKPALRLGLSKAASRTGSDTLPPAAAESGQAVSGQAASGQAARDAQQPRKTRNTRKASKRPEAVAVTSDQNGSGGEGSGSILLSPLVLVMIGAVIAAALGMTLSRSRGDHSESEGVRSRQGPRQETTGPRTPEGEIVAGPDQVT
jgi:hypothetical protein